MTVTQDSGSQALVSRLFVQGVSYENGLAMARRFLDSLKWSK
jgi:hypothetical protein